MGWTRAAEASRGASQDRATSPRRSVPSRSRGRSRELAPTQERVDHSLDVARERLEVDSENDACVSANAEPSEAMTSFELGVRRLDAGADVVPFLKLARCFRAPPTLEVRGLEVHLDDGVAVLRLRRATRSERTRRALVGVEHELDDVAIGDELLRRRLVTGRAPCGTLELRIDDEVARRERALLDLLARTLRGGSADGADDLRAELGSFHGVLGRAVLGIGHE